MNIQYVKGVGEKRAQLFAKLDVFTLYDLVHLFPRNYLDFSCPAAIRELKPGSVYCVRAIVGSDISEARIRQGMTIYKTVVTDGDGVLHITIYNNRYLAEKLRTGEEFLFYGKVINNRGALEMGSPIVESANLASPIRPIYPLTASLSSKTVENAVKNALELYYKTEPSDPIPDAIRKRFSLCHEQFALKSIHFPSCLKDAEIARRRLIFEELLVLQSGMLLLRKRNKQKTDIVFKNDYTPLFIRSLPFELTNAQKKAVADAVNDTKKSEPMNRLVQGDVGSGKTVVAAALMFSAAKNGFQSALMAPTEVLAAQHYKTLSSMMPEDIRLALLTGSSTAKEKRETKAALEKGEIDILVGTHAIITDNTLFSSLGLVVTDEQHRFGVRQRGALSKKGKRPHVLVMSATPIPRTLSLIIYGDLDISIIDELPKGRQKIKTYLVDSSYRTRVYNYVKKHLDRGLQGYIVCPLVEENESELVSAVKYAEEISKKEFASYSVALLHGKMKPKEKARIMQEFSEGKIQLLVSTTVIEVGIDVPNAVIMVIENAERFGLSTLHQLRGRVGRGSVSSSCILISDAEGETAKKRLEIMCSTTDGFKIADADLHLRGPGDFFGSRQHGLPTLQIAGMLDDMVLLEETKKAAQEIFETDPFLKSKEHEKLRDCVIRLFKKTGQNALN